MCGGDLLASIETEAIISGFKKFALSLQTPLKVKITEFVSFSYTVTPILGCAPFQGRRDYVMSDSLRPA